MKHLSGEEERKIIGGMFKAAQVAKESTCQQAKYGAVLVKDSEVIGQGFNSPPSNKESLRRCGISKDSYHKKVSDKTCCIHAEQRAILNGLVLNPRKVKNSTLFIGKTDATGIPLKAGAPYCTICSKLALEVGIKDIVLWQVNGLYVYDAEEYNSLSYAYKETI